MRHRIGGGINGFGNPEPCKLLNNYELKNKSFWDEFLKDAMSHFKLIDENAGFDFTIQNNHFTFGIEPSYMGDDLLIIQFDFLFRNYCSKTTGHSFGPYGSGIRKRVKYYKEYKKQCAFVDFIDKWYWRIKYECNRIMKNESKGAKQ